MTTLRHTTITWAPAKAPSATSTSGSVGKGVMVNPCGYTPQVFLLKAISNLCIYAFEARKDATPRELAAASVALDLEFGLRRGRQRHGSGYVGAARNTAHRQFHPHTA